MKFNDVLSRDEITALVLRNNMNPDIGRPHYVAWTDNKGVCATVSQLLEANKRAGLANCAPFTAADQLRWQRRLHSKKWRFQYEGSKEAKLIERPLRTRDGWRMVPMNAKV